MIPASSVLRPSALSAIAEKLTHSKQEGKYYTLYVLLCGSTAYSMFMFMKSGISDVRLHLHHYHQNHQRTKQLAMLTNLEIDIMIPTFILIFFCLLPVTNITPNIPTTNGLNYYM